MSSPDRGEVWLVDLSYVAKVRPCLVVSLPVLIEDRALTTLVPYTTQNGSWQWVLEDICRCTT